MPPLLLPLLQLLPLLRLHLNFSYAQPNNIIINTFSSCLRCWEPVRHTSAGLGTLGADSLWETLWVKAEMQSKPQTESTKGPPKKKKRQRAHTQARLHEEISIFEELMMQSAQLPRCTVGQSKHGIHAMHGQSFYARSHSVFISLSLSLCALSQMCLPADSVDISTWFTKAISGNDCNSALTVSTKSFQHTLHSYLLTCIQLVFNFDS